jgi:hypothetical protein
MLTLIGFSLAALSNIRTGAADAYAQIQFEKDSQRIGQLAEELCLLGPGNSRDILIPELFHARYYGGTVEFSQGNWTGTHVLSCPFEESDLWGNLILENKEGKIKKKE